MQALLNNVISSGLRVENTLHVKCEGLILTKPSLPLVLCVEVACISITLLL